MSLFLGQGYGAATYIVHRLPCSAQLRMPSRPFRTPGGVLKVICIQESLDMYEQYTSKNARLIGYALGAIVVTVTLGWKIFTR